MPRKDLPTLGVDLSDAEIRAVEVKFRGGKPYVSNAGVRSMPDGVFARGVVQHPAAAGLALRALLDDMGIAGSPRVVFGVENERTNFRQMAVPPVPDSDLPSVIAVEADHFGLVRTNRGAYGHIKLTSPTKPHPNDSLNVIVLGVEEDVTGNLASLAYSANVTIAAVEPATLALLRAALVTLNSPPTALILALSSFSTDAAFFANGSLILFRRIDIGSKAIAQVIPAAMPTAFISGGGFGEDGPVEDLGTVLNEQGVQNLALEAKRTLSYLEREFPDFAAVEQVHLVVRESGLEPLGDLIAEKLGLPAAVIRPNFGTDAPAAVKSLAGDDNFRFTAAYGQALHNSHIGGTAIPSMDLFNKERVAVQQQETKRNFAGSVIVSILGIVLGIGAWFLYGNEIKKVQADTDAARTTAETIRKKTDQVTADRLKKTEQYKALRKEGAPVGPLMDYVASYLDPGVGLVQFSVSNSLDVTMQAEATSEQAIINTQRNLLACPLLKNVFTNSFNQAAGKRGPIQFQVTAQTVSAARIRMNAPAPAISAPTTAAAHIPPSGTTR